MRAFPTVALLAALVAAGCGSGGFPGDVPSDSPPIVSRIEPDTGAPGDAITIYGVGYSFVPPNNIVIIGGAASTATDYRLLDNPTEGEVEAIDATVPAEAAAGEGGVVVMVADNVSNSNITFTVIP